MIAGEGVVKATWRPVTAAGVLSRLTVEDALTQALAGTSADESVPAATVDWVIRSVRQELRTAARLAGEVYL